MRDSSRRWFAVGVTAMTLGAFHSSVRTEQPSVSSIDLTTLFATGGVLQDRNGDGVVDFVNARILLRERPGAVDVSAASDIAARLGFETMAMNLPLSSVASACTDIASLASNSSPSGTRCSTTKTS